MLISLDHITKTYTGDAGPIVAVDDVSVSVEAGEFVAVVGPSGCGKTTLLLVAGGLLRPENGEVSIDGTDPYSLSGEQRARFRAEQIGFVFQQFHLVPYLNVLDNVMAPALVTGETSARERAGILVERFGLADRLGHRPGQLSTGERQRVALARALLNEPRVILADEPTGNLDGDNSEQVLQALKTFADEGGAVLLVTHDPDAVAFAGRQVVLQGGQLASSESEERIGETTSAIPRSLPNSAADDDVVADSAGRRGRLADVASRRTSFSQYPRITCSHPSSAIDTACLLYKSDAAD